MTLPPELLAPPPRNPAAAERLLNKTKKTAQGVMFSGAALFPVVLVLFWLQFGTLETMMIVISLGISTLVELMGLALWVNSRRSLQLFREGMAAVGTIRKVTAPPDNRGNAYVFLEVEFRGAGGMMKVGRVTTIGHVSEIDARVGAEVAVLHSPTDDRRFAVYTPGMGMIAGVVAPR